MPALAAHASPPVSLPASSHALSEPRSSASSSSAARPAAVLPTFSASGAQMAGGSGSLPTPTGPEPGGLSLPSYAPVPYAPAVYARAGAAEASGSPVVARSSSENGGASVGVVVGRERREETVRGCRCCLHTLSPMLLVTAAFWAWSFRGALAGEVVLFMAVVPAMVFVYGLHTSVGRRSLPGVTLLEFFWLGAFLSVFIAMCLELLANALFYTTFLSCLPPLPSSSSSSFVPSFASNDLLSAFLSSQAPEVHATPEPPVASWLATPLFAPLSLPFYLPLFGSAQGAGPSCVQKRQAALQTGVSAASFAVLSPLSSSFSPATPFLSPEAEEGGWTGFLLKVSNRVFEPGALPSVWCSLGLLAFMIFCVGLVEEFAKFVVLHRLRILPAAAVWAGADEVFASESDEGGETRAEDARPGGCCGGFWTRYVKYPVGICLAGCAAGAGFAMAENISYTLGSRRPLVEDFVVAFVRVRVGLPLRPQIAGRQFLFPGLDRAAESKLVKEPPCAASDFHCGAVSHREHRDGGGEPGRCSACGVRSARVVPCVLLPLALGAAPAAAHSVLGGLRGRGARGGGPPAFWRLLFPSLFLPSVLHGTYDAALRLSAAFAQPGAPFDENSAVLASVFLIVSFVAWLMTLIAFWRRWRCVRDLPAFGADATLRAVLPTPGPAAGGPLRHGPPAPSWAGAVPPAAICVYHAAPASVYAPLGAPAHASLLGGRGGSAVAGVRADVLLWEERRRKESERLAGAIAQAATAPAEA
ncbi:hypothetical protein BESB_035150 [Besnoitia besnoiti]|uniref:Protease prsW family protein n=1 Tax=Besnoitia besnoiti TaxID=94643 RepID=A0A2A9MMP2_BESBE|nr:hypothetical protein BESB_035150 [Besnoitia besnoiti]PFH37057.1 hypothetical protein BESB_035150 [Besnoitia besnoiti]